MNTSKTTSMARAQERDTVSLVSNRVRAFTERGELHLPPDYSADNALKAAWLDIQNVKTSQGKLALQTCTKNSVANALLNMVLQGLNPAKKQCYFIAYGDQLLLQRSYFGAMHVAMQVDPTIQYIGAEVVHAGDVFTYKKTRGRTEVTEHSQSIENLNAPIVAAYCTVVRDDGTEDTTIMSIADIQAAWSMNRQNNPVNADGTLNPRSTHAKFTGEMAKKTVINRACKQIINASGDAGLVMQAYNDTDRAEAEAEADAQLEQIHAETTPFLVEPEAEAEQTTQQAVAEIEVADFDDLP